MYDFDWPLDIPVLAVSAGIHCVPDCHHFVSLDRPVCFPKWVTDSDRFTTHIVDNKFAASWKKANKRVRVWDYLDRDFPTFGRGPIVTGPLSRNDSLLASVQIAACLGYRRLMFIGCDLLENERWDIATVLRSWYPLARASGIEWQNLSPISALNEWMPRDEEVCV